MQLKKIGVVGAGTMGSAIAQHFSTKGLAVTLVDTNPAGLERGMSSIRKTLDEAKQRSIVTDEEVGRIFGRLTATTKLSDLAGCQLIVEAVFEDLQVKKNLFKDLENIVAPECILASNTSSFLVTDIADGLKNPSRVIGVHYFYHAAKNKLVELIPGQKTSPECLERLWNFYGSCGKIAIVVKDAPGFAVNRFFVPWLNEATRLYEEGYGSIAFIDEVARETFQIGMGPFALMNATGVPIAMHAALGLADKTGKFYSPSEILKHQVGLKKDWRLDDQTVLKGGSNNAKPVRERLLVSALGVAAQLVSEGVTDAAATDLGARVGLRWPKGPFEMMKEIGVSETQTMITKYFKQWDLKVPQISDPLEIEFVKSRIAGKDGIITFSMPDRMNPLSEEVMSQLENRFDALRRDSKVERIILTGQGKAFVAGADIKFFVDAIDRKDVERIYRFTAYGQSVLNKLSASAKPTIAYLEGLTLGGGLELALACRYRIATPKALFAFPETGIGIYPGLGGTQRTARLIGKRLAKFMIATGQMVDAQTAFKYGLVDRLVDVGVDATKLGPLDKPQQGKAMPSDGFPEDVFADFDGKLSAELFAQEGFKKFEKVLRRKAPLALTKAMELVDQGMALSLQEGLALELKHLNWIFQTQDARTGLSSIINKTRPEFCGK